MPISVVISGRRAGEKFQTAMRTRADDVKTSLNETVQIAAAQIVARGRTDIAAGGNFGSPRWQTGLHATVTQGGGNRKITVRHDVSYWRVFEFGAVIRGKPMLWIPLSFALDALKVRARDFRGRLFRVDRKRGAPLLMASMGRGAPAQAKYFGKRSVTSPKKFHLRAIIRQVSREMPGYFKRAMSVRKR